MLLRGAFFFLLFCSKDKSEEEKVYSARKKFIRRLLFQRSCRINRADVGIGPYGAVTLLFQRSCRIDRADVGIGPYGARRLISDCAR